MLAAIRKLLSVVTHVLVVLVFCAGLLSLAYAAMPQLSISLETGEETDWPKVFEALREASSQAVFALSSGAAAGAVSQAAQGAAATGEAPDYPWLRTDLSIFESGGATTAVGADDLQAQELYQAWKDDISSPVARVFAGTHVTQELIEGVSGGSISAVTALSDLDDAALAAVGTNADSLFKTARAHQVSYALPEDVQEQMHRADEACQEFCVSAMEMARQASSLKSGNVTAAVDLASTAAEAIAHLSDMDEAMGAAESLLGL